jgi:hypothetical protein
VRASDATRWGQLVFGIICMVMTANLQYGWTLFVSPIDKCALKQWPQAERPPLAVRKRFSIRHGF